MSIIVEKEPPVPLVNTSSSINKKNKGCNSRRNRQMQQQKKQHKHQALLETHNNNSHDTMSNSRSQPQAYSYKHATTLSIAKILLVLLTQAPLRIMASPIYQMLTTRSSSNSTHTVHESPKHGDEPMESQEYWTDLILSCILVLLGGVFAGLTLGLMGQDEIYLQVMVQSGEPAEKKAAKKVLSVLNRGRHWVLVTLLLCNVITNESLPIVLDKILGGGWPAVVSSTIAIVIFGEIIPQSVSVRYGLAIGAWFAPFVLALMYITYPVAYPVALLLDWALGEQHGTFYKKAGLKTLVGLHKTMGVERLNDDEVTIISAVLDLKDKPVALIMTPMEDVFTMSADRILDEPTIEQILHSGFNRIPIHAPDEPTNFIGMLLVRTLITYDPEDNYPISSFPLATLPETGPETSCLNILNYFQEGKSHMVVVSKNPGAPVGAVGVLTLEDVIEELIGEEIIDESDVYVDVHKAIRRTHPGPLSKATSLALFRHSPRASMGYDDDGIKHKLNPLNKASNPKHTTNANITIKRSNLESFTTGSASSGQTSKSVPIYDENGNIVAGVYRPSNLSTQLRDEDIEDATGTKQLLSTSGESYGTVHRTEQDTVKAALIQSGSSVVSESDGKYLKVNKNKDNDSQNINTNGKDGSSNGGLELPSSNSPELHSYRAGGLIESIVNVDGVSKTIIEDTSNNGDNNGTSSASSWRSHHDSDPDNQPLLPK